MQFARCFWVQQALLRDNHCRAVPKAVTCHLRANNRCIHEGRHEPIFVPALSLGGEQRVDADGEAVEQDRGGSGAAREAAMLLVGMAGQRQHGDRLVRRVDDPVLGNARLRVVGALAPTRHQMPSRPHWRLRDDRQARDPSEVARVVRYEAGTQL